MSIEQAAVPEIGDTTPSDSDEAAADSIEPPPLGTIAYSVMQALEALPPDKQQELLDFAEFLQHKLAPKRPQRSLKGLWADLNIHITEEDIAEARHEMWGNFPRDDF
jgi:hypothetical protein